MSFIISEEGRSQQTHTEADRETAGQNRPLIYVTHSAPIVYENKPPVLYIPLTISPKFPHREHNWWWIAHTVVLPITEMELSPNSNWLQSMTEWFL